MRKVQSTGEGYYHVYNRGVEKRDVFLREQDYLRFVKGMIAFNDIGRQSTQSLSRIQVSPSDRPYVHIHAFCLMKNHFHFLLEEKTVFGVAEFMRRLGSGYTRYFNNCNKRSGRLFEGPYKSIRVESDTYLLHLTRYIHRNPLGFLKKKHTDEPNPLTQIQFLKNYRWSSLHDYLGNKKFSFIDTSIRNDAFQNPEEYEAFLLHIP